MDEIRASFSIIEDPRHQGYVKHKLTDILIIIMCAVLSGMDTLGNISIYATSQEKMLKEKFDVQSAPSKATFGRIHSMVDGAKVGTVIIDIMEKQLGVMGDVKLYCYSYNIVFSPFIFTLN